MYACTRKCACVHVVSAFLTVKCACSDYVGKHWSAVFLFTVAGFAWLLLGLSINSLVVCGCHALAEKDTEDVTLAYWLNDTGGTAFMFLRVVSTVSLALFSVIMMGKGGGTGMIVPFVVALQTAWTCFGRSKEVPTREEFCAAINSVGAEEVTPGSWIGCVPKSLSKDAKGLTIDIAGAILKKHLEKDVQTTCASLTNGPPPGTRTESLPGTTSELQAVPPTMVQQQTIAVEAPEPNSQALST